MRLPVRLQREVARQHYYYTSQSNRAIGRALGVAANTVRSVRPVLQEHRAQWADLESLSDDAWCAILGSGNPTPKSEVALAINMFNILCRSNGERT